MLDIFNNAQVDETIQTMKGIMNSLVGMVYITVPETGEILFISDSMKKHYGIEDDITGKYCFEVLQDGMKERCSFCPCNVLDKDPSQTIVWEEHSTLTKRVYRNTDKYMQWPNRDVVHFQHSVDITDLVNATEEIKHYKEETEALNNWYKSILNTIPLQISVTDTDMNWTFVNKATEEFLGRKSKDMLGKPCSSWNSNICNTSDCGINCLRRGIKRTFFSQKEFTYQVDVDTLKDLEGKTAGYIEVVQDITQLREAEALRQMRKANERIQLMFDAMPLCASYWTKDLQISGCNDEIVRMLGLSSKQEYSERFFELSPELQPDGRNSKEKSLELVQRAFEEGYCRTEWIMQSVTKEPIPVDLSLVKVIHDDDEFVIVYVRDLREMNSLITEIESMAKLQAEMEAELAIEEMAKNQARAEAASAAKSEFLAHMSHEIRTPMNSVIGFTDLALEEEVSDHAKDYLQKIMENSRLLLQIINDILDISKIESGNMQLEYIPFDLRDLIANCQSVMHPKALEKKLDLHFYAEPSIKRKLYGDPLRLRQVLLNLLSNAVKFTEEGRVSLNAVITAESDKKVTLRFEVKDNGIGMTQEQIEVVFNPFTQADISTTRKYGGTGLGLSIVKNLLELMDSRLEIESEPDVGSMFSFVVTLDIAEDIDELEYESDNGETNKPLFKGDVLVFEDNKMNQQVILDHLTRVGLNADIADNGLIGIDIIKKRITSGLKPYDLIFMDIQMPVMDGIEATPKVIALGTGTPVITMTANVLSEDMSLYKRLGMTDYLSKPFTSKELWRCLLKYLKPIGFEAADEADDTLMKKLKTEFFKSNRYIYNDIVSALDNEDMTLAYRLAHTIKSNAGQIGKTKLQKAALDIESAFKDNRKAETELYIFQYELDKVLEELRSLLDEDRNTSYNNPSDLTGNPDEIEKIFDKILPLLRDSNLAAIEMIKELQMIPDSEEVIGLIEEMYFKAAEKALIELREKRK